MKNRFLIHLNRRYNEIIVIFVFTVQTPFLFKSNRNIFFIIYRCFNSSPPLTSITPDSLEISLRSANTTELNMASYNSHKYATRKPLTQKRFLEDEVFVDSLEPGEERSVI